MTKPNSLQLKLELYWWLFTAVVVIGIIYPILSNLTSYPFLFINILFIVVFITLTRFVFLLEHTILARRERWKVGIVLISVPIIFVLIEKLSGFQTFMDETTFDAFMTDLPLDKQIGMNRYIRSEMLLFGVGSVMISIIFPFRMILSVWRNRNTNKV